MCYNIAHGAERNFIFYYKNDSLRGRGSDRIPESVEDMDEIQLLISVEYE